MEPAVQFDAGLPPQIKDRKTGLVVFGILQILCAAVCLCLVPLLIFGQVMSSRMTGAGTTYRIILPAIFVYAALAGLFLVLGIGSIRARRWARAFSLIVGWTWLVGGTIGVIVDAFILPAALGRNAPGGAALPPGARMIVVIITLAFLTLVMVALPLALVLFYRSSHVRATCERLNPIPCWTDRSPLPVLGLSSWLMLGGVGMLLMPLAYAGVAPFFGSLISGLMGCLFYLCLGLLFIYLARSVFQLKPSAWWVILVASLLFGVSNMLTFSRIDITDMYRQMGYPEAQIKQLQDLHFNKQSWMVLASALGVLPLLGYLWYVRRFFRPGAAAPK